MNSFYVSIVVKARYCTVVRVRFGSASEGATYKCALQFLCKSMRAPYKFFRNWMEVLAFSDENEATFQNAV